MREIASILGHSLVIQGDVTHRTEVELEFAVRVGLHDRGPGLTPVDAGRGAAELLATHLRRQS